MLMSAKKKCSRSARSTADERRRVVRDDEWYDYEHFRQTGMPKLANRILPWVVPTQLRQSQPNYDPII